MQSAYLPRRALLFNAGDVTPLMISFVLLHHSHFLRERRRKTLLWLDDNPNSPENSRIRRSIPGHSSSEAVEGLCDDRLSLAADNTDIALEDQVDVSLFTTVDALDKFLCHPSQHKFAKYPPSLFRIVTNRRLFVGADGLCSSLSRNATWRSAFPATLVFHGAVHDGLHELMGRPNLTITQVAADCEAFVSFQAVKAEVHRTTEAAAFAPQVMRWVVNLLFVRIYHNIMLQIVVADDADAALHVRLPVLCYCTHCTMLWLLTCEQAALQTSLATGADAGVAQQVGSVVFEISHVMRMMCAWMKPIERDRHSMNDKRVDYNLQIFQQHSRQDICHGLKCAQFDVFEFRAAGYDLSALASAGFSGAELTAAGFLSEVVVKVCS
jgi:hypothetical protein